MDEVLAVGDMAFQKKCLDKMRDVAKKEGRTVLYVSHNMNTIRQLCDRCVVLDKGKIVFLGDVEQAIALYLNSGDAEESVFTDLTGRSRPVNSTNKAFMQSITFAQREDCVLVRGEKLRMRLKWRAKQDLKDVKFRMIVRYADDSPVGLVQSASLGDYSMDQQVESDLLFDTSLLSDGKYYFSIALFQSDDVGNSVILDHVTRACIIEVISPLDEEKLLNWEHRYWGSVRFPDLEIIN